MTASQQGYFYFLTSKKVILNYGVHEFPISASYLMELTPDDHKKVKEVLALVEKTPRNEYAAILKALTA